MEERNKTLEKVIDAKRPVQRNEGAILWFNKGSSQPRTTSATEAGARGIERYAGAPPFGEKGGNLK